jgi:hypothetical protein
MPSCLTVFEEGGTPTFDQKLRDANVSTFSLALSDFANLFGTSSEELSAYCGDLVAAGDFRYRRISGRRRESVLLSVLQRINSPDLSVAGAEGARDRWEKGWSENLENLSASGFDLGALRPKYIRQTQPVRLFQDYVEPLQPDLEFNWYRIFTRWLFLKYFSDVDAVYEFGCGSGINIATLAKLFPGKRLMGMDWTTASKRILGELAKVHGWNVEGRVFDFFEPDEALEIPRGRGVLTLGALEQTGQNYEKFLQYLVRSCPSICVHVELIVEWYDPNNLVDYLAILFHNRRGYWSGFPRRLKELEKEGKVRVLKEKRSFFGSLFIEGYSQIVWKPIDEGSRS